jgi:DNA-binding SARP family transcriptional activator
VPATLVAAQGPGYSATVDREQVDAHRFARLVQQARASAGSGTTASRLYTEALELWRGPALADFSVEPWAAGEATRLEELRLAAIEERIDLDLNSGRHATWSTSWRRWPPPTHCGSGCTLSSCSPCTGPVVRPMPSPPSKASGNSA